MTKRVLLVGQGLFSEGLVHLLAEAANVSLVGAVNTWDEAQSLLKQEVADVLILDHPAIRVDEAELAALFRTPGRAIQVIYLTLAENRLTLYAHKEVANATVDDLLGILGSLDSGQGRGEV